MNIKHNTIDKISLQMLGVNKTAITKPTSKPKLTRDTRQLKNSKNSETLCIGKVVHP